MAKRAGTDFGVMLVDGFNLLPSIVENVTVGEEVITQQTNGFGVATESHTPVGIEKGVLVAGGGFYDIAVDPLFGNNATVTGVSRIVCAAIYGNVPGRSFAGWQGVYNTKYELMDAKDGLVKANVTYLVSGSIDEGQIVQDHQPFTATWDTKTGGANAPDTPVDYTLYDGNRAINITSNSIANPSVVTCTTAHGLTTGDKVLISGVITSSPTINGSFTTTVISPTTFSVPVNVTVAGTGGSFVKVNTNAGGIGYAQCSAYSGLTSVVLKIMHSPDDTTYAALVTFTTITAANTKERLTVAGNVDRYLSSQGTVVGSGSATVFSGFVRN